MTMVVLLLALWAMLTVAHGTPIGRAMHRVMVEMPVAAINAITRGHLLLAAAVFGLTCIVAWFGEADGLRMLSMAVPDAAAWVTTFEISAYLDIIAALVATSAVTRIRTITSQVIAAIMPRRRMARKPRARSVGLPRPTKAANDDEDGAFALAG